jgi:hypothetical protein
MASLAELPTTCRPTPWDHEPHSGNGQPVRGARARNADAGVGQPNRRLPIAARDGPSHGRLRSSERRTDPAGASWWSPSASAPSAASVASRRRSGSALTAFLELGVAAPALAPPVARPRRNARADAAGRACRHCLERVIAPPTARSPRAGQARVAAAPHQPRTSVLRRLASSRSQVVCAIWHRHLLTCPARITSCTNRLVLSGIHKFFTQAQRGSSHKWHGFLHVTGVSFGASRSPAKWSTVSIRVPLGDVYVCCS